MDPDKRATFDRYGEEGVKGNGARRHSATDPNNFGSHFGAGHGGYRANGFSHPHHIDPFEVFRRFFGTGDPFSAFGHFGMHAHAHHAHHQHAHHAHVDPFFTDPFFSGRGSLFDDLVDSTSNRQTPSNSDNNGVRSSHTTTFMTGDGNTIHITRTVIGGDGSVRREMRFRTPQEEASSRPTARVTPTSRHSHHHSSSEARGRPDGASAAEPDTTTTSTSPTSKPPAPTSSNSTPSSARRGQRGTPGNVQTPSYASPTQSSARRTAGVGAPAASPMPTPTSSTSSPSSRVSGSSNTPGSRYQPSQRNGVRSRPSGGARRRANNHHNHNHQKQLIQCPLCSRSFEKEVIEIHAANCEGRPEDIPEVVTIRDEEPQPPAPPKVECPICNQSYSQTDIEQHAANCGEEVYV